MLHQRVILFVCSIAISARTFLVMRTSDEHSDDERGLLDDKWVLRKEEKSWRIWVASLLCLCSGFALGTLFGRMPASRSPVHEHLNGEIMIAPFEPSVKITFQPNETFERAMPGPDADSLWEALMPVGRGFVQVQPNGDLVPHDSPPNNVSQTKAIAAFHQMHCLNNLRKSLYASVSNESTFTYRIPQLEHHWRHCFDYLRQALMCNADVTLETLEMRGDMVVGSVDGWGTEHVCRDWDGLKDWAQGGRGTNDGGID
ncbi:hypothetical protein K458DRAFT_452845 [Lentithecium fluviatile CBS 122367]|uniref:Oxidase ustYa n=1 Tax=Lentithecium fluviatile CBS 122367 TaxID=1168545 RepID=A0A6G1IYK6_9PLEO|nr:hypothetical protein K458DRAFT_452845 [Lentithecium fluviatile CBS 122367]